MTPENVGELLTQWLSSECDEGVQSAATLCISTLHLMVSPQYFILSSGLQSGTLSELLAKEKICSFKQKEVVVDIFFHLRKILLILIVDLQALFVYCWSGQILPSDIMKMIWPQWSWNEVISTCCSKVHTEPLLCVLCCWIWVQCPSFRSGSQNLIRRVNAVQAPLRNHGIHVLN